MSQVAFHQTQVAVFDSTAKTQQGIDQSARNALLDFAYCFSPRVEVVEDRLVVADITGTERLFGSPERLASASAALAAEFGFSLNIGIASNPDTAVHIARGYSGITVVQAGEEAAWLAPLPVNVLGASPEIMEILEAWGIRNCKALAELPSIPLVERLGQEGLKLQQLARGEVTRTLVPADPPLEFVESFEFEDPVESLESISFILNRLLQRLCIRLAARALATNELRLSLSLEARQVNHEKRGEFYERVWKLPVTTQNPKTLFSLMYLDLRATSHSAPIRAITLRAEPAKERSTQHSFFIPTGPEPEELEVALRRIRGLVSNTDTNGIGRVGSPKILDSHKPDTFEILPFSVGRKNAANTPKQSCLTFRTFRPPLPVKVEVNDEVPASVMFKRKRVSVLTASGPWKGSGEWWSDSTAWTRDEWDVALNIKEKSGFYRIFYDLIQKQWFVGGMFD